MINNLTNLIRTHEGIRLFPYKCPAGKLTIGFGRNLEARGITVKEAEFLLENDLAKIKVDLNNRIDFFGHLDDVRQAILIDMAYNLGTKGLLSFRRMLHYLDLGNYKKAAKEMLDSKWAKQVGRRAVKLSHMMRDGNWS